MNGDGFCMLKQHGRCHMVTAGRSSQGWILDFIAKPTSHDLAHTKKKIGKHVMKPPTVRVSARHVPPRETSYLAEKNLLLLSATNNIFTEK